MSTTLRTPDAFWQHALAVQLKQQLAQFPPEQYFMVGCSGGRDSLCLLFTLIQVAGPARVCAVTVNHQIHPDAATWCERVKTYCQQWGVRCFVETVSVASGNEEQQARIARFGAFKRVLAKLPTPHCLVLGHHLQDQSETVLLRLFRGSGLRGLSAMKQHGDRQGLEIWRPWLSVDRRIINELCQLLALEYIEDSANWDDQYSRVFLRQHITPVLDARFTGWVTCVGRSAELLTDAQHVITAVVEQDLVVCRASDGALQLESLLQLPPARQRLLLAHWIQGGHHYAPPQQLIKQVFVQMMDGAADAQPQLLWYDIQIRQFGRKLYRLPQNLPTAVSFKKKLTIGDELHLPSGHWRVVESQFGFDLAWLNQPLQFQLRQGGERIKLSPHQPHQTLKKILQMAKLAPWQRDQIHLLYHHDQLLAVLGEVQLWTQITTVQSTPGWILSKIC